MEFGLIIIVTCGLFGVGLYYNIHKMCPLSNKAVISSTAIFVVMANNTLYGSKLYIFILCQKSLDIKIMFHEDILYRKYIKT